ncbi:MAG: Fe2+-dependent dioxygenase [Kiloniellales bacterium]|nr:Fe2+-dependent dioxygenase [Kiloniellales bacterium]
MIVCIDGVLDRSQLNSALEAIRAADFVDGRETAGFRAKLVKNNLQLKKQAPGAEGIKETVVKALKGNKEFQRAAIPRIIQKPLISRYQEGMNYGLHVDDALMGGDHKVRTDLSVTLFLNDPSDYQGGELIVETAAGEEEVKLPAGAAVVYPSGALHRVAPVTRGERVAAVTWVESYVRDPLRREALADLDLIRCRLAEVLPDSRETDLAFKTYANLLRMWAET